MAVSFHKLNTLVLAGKKTLFYDAEKGLAWYEVKELTADDDETTVMVREYLPTRDEIQNILNKTNNEKDGLQLVKNFYLANPA
jgi:hypothetical protein